MELSDNVIQFAVMAFIAIAVGAAAFAVLFPFFSGEAQANKRIASVTEKAGKSDGSKKSGSFRSRLKEDSKDTRRRQVQESLKQLEEREKQRKKRITLRMLMLQAGLDLSPQNFYVASAITGALAAFGTWMGGAPAIVAGVAGLVGALGLPRWALSYMRNRRQEIFLHDFADAIDVMVRGLKAGLPANDAMRIIATETGPPVGPEFTEVVEGQRVGITIGQGIERMYERMPVSEVNFLAIVMAIQAKTGGNLAEALSNLSVVLRDRKKMKLKIKAVSQEAKASASIIGSLPFLLCAAMAVLNPKHLNPLWETQTGNLMVVGSLVWMSIGVLIMRKMINFKI